MRVKERTIAPLQRKAIRTRDRLLRLQQTAREGGEERESTRSGEGVEGRGEGGERGREWRGRERGGGGRGGRGEWVCERGWFSFQSWNRLCIWNHP